MARTLNGRPVVPGDAAGTVLHSKRSLSLWGGIDPRTGRIIDRRHDRHGEAVGGRVLVFPAEKGSSTGSAVLLELIRVRRAPASIVTSQLAPILALGAILAEELYGASIPIVLLSPDDLESLDDGEQVRVRPDGSIERLEN